MSLYNFVFGTESDVDSHILQQLNGNNGTQYMLNCYNNLKTKESKECVTYFNNYFNMFLSSDYWRVNYVMIIDKIIKEKDDKLFKLIMQIDNFNDILDKILINCRNL